MKRGDATMVATVLLIVAAIIVGVLVATFSRETEKKVEGKIIDMGNVVECEDIGIGLVIDTTSDTPSIKIKNTGTLGIDKIYLRGYNDVGGTNTIEMTFDEVEDKLKPNVESNPIDPAFIANFGEKIEFIPVIITEENKEIGCERKIVTWKNE